MITKQAISGNDAFNGKAKDNIGGRANKSSLHDTDSKTATSLNNTSVTNDREGTVTDPVTVAVLPTGNKGFTGNVYLDGILWGGNYWNSNSSPTKIDYSFWNSGTGGFDDPYDNIATNPVSWFAGEKAAMVKALDSWAAVANIQFVNAGDNNEFATFGFYLLGDSDADGFLGMFNPPGTDGMGIGYFNWQGDGWNVNGNTPGDFGFITLIHELGHGLGLAHPHDNGGGSSIYPGVTSAFGDTGDHGLNQGLYTTMSYNDGLVYGGANPGTNDYGYQGTPMAFDIAAIQHLYGPNLTYKTGNDTYFLPTVNQIGTSYACIWDAGGIDTISGDGATTGVTINLNDATLNAAYGSGAGGYLSSASSIFGGFTIANKVVIENATGSGLADSLKGNEFNNTLNGAAGADTMDGGDGNDTYYVDNVGDIVKEVYDDTLGGTADTVFSSVSYSLLPGTAGQNGYGIENLTLTGIAAINGIGNGKNNTLTGNGANNTLNGGNGSDRINAGSGSDILLGGAGNDELVGQIGNDSLTGGVGQDKFTFKTKGEGVDTITDFSVLDDTIQVSKAGFGGGLTSGAVITAAQFHIGNGAQDLSDRFIYNKNTGVLFFDADGTGALAPILFAQLSTNLALTNADIYVTA